MYNTLSCIDCKMFCTPSVLGTGFGRTQDGKVICYQCCAERDRQTMREGKPITLYLDMGKGFAYNPMNPLGPSGHTGEVTNWPGTLRLQAFTTPYRHNMNRKARNVWVWFEGRQWYGRQVDGGGQLVTLRPTKKNTTKQNHKAA